MKGYTQNCVEDAVQRFQNIQTIYVNGYLMLWIFQVLIGLNCIEKSEEKANRYPVHPLSHPFASVRSLFLRLEPLCI